jgi:hypothetical protein
MDSTALRSWGIAAGAVLLAGALAIANTDDSAAIAPSAVTVPIAAPGAPDALFTPAQAEAPVADGAPIGFVVRFEGAGPLGRAQAAAARGRLRQAQSAAEQALARQRQFRGLCFDRFTVGGAEMVLRSCAPVAANQRAQVTNAWLSRLRAIPAVAYADVNSAAATQRAP